MCGIVGGRLAPDVVARGVSALAHRGPDANGIFAGDPISLGHTRLAIVDLDSRSDCPFTYGQTTLVYNGEVWNYEQIRAELEADGAGPFYTTGDTEVVAAALNRWGNDALPRLEGMFAMAWTHDGGQTCYLTRDRYGEIPLHVWSDESGAFAFASELRGLIAMGVPPAEMLEPGVVMQVGPGHTERHLERWYVTPIDGAPTISFDDAAAGLRTRLEDAVADRAMADVPVAALVSGGIDSTTIAAMMARHVPDLRCYTAVLNERSADLKFARRAMDDLGLTLVEVRVPAPTADDLVETVRRIEMPHKAQVEIAWACLWLARRISEDGAKVVVSGEGSDELWAAYGFAWHALQRKRWGPYRRELFVGQHAKNFARTNKVFMAHGVEARLPFLHRPVVEWVLSLPQSICWRDGKGHEAKVVLEEATEGLIPGYVRDRQKLAFQKGTGMREAAAEAVGARNGDARGFYKAAFERYLSGQESML